MSLHQDQGHRKEHEPTVKPSLNAIAKNTVRDIAIILLSIIDLKQGETNISQVLLSQIVSDAVIEKL